MKGLELIQTYPAAGKVVKDWFFKSMLESFKDDSLPDEFKEFMLEQGIEDDKIGILIDVNPRMLFDVFDDNDVIIQIIPIKEDKVKYLSRVNQFETPYDFTRPYFTRKEAELASIEAAFEILENNLSPKVEE